MFLGPACNIIHFSIYYNPLITPVLAIILSHFFPRKVLLGPCVGTVLPPSHVDNTRLSQNLGLRDERWELWHWNTSYNTKLVYFTMSLKPNPTFYTKLSRPIANHNKLRIHVTGRLTSNGKWTGLLSVVTGKMYARFRYLLHSLAELSCMEVTTKRNRRQKPFQSISNIVDEAAGSMKLSVGRNYPLRPALPARRI